MWVQTSSSLKEDSSSEHQPLLPLSWVDTPSVLQGWGKHSRHWVILLVQNEQIPIRQSRRVVPLLAYSCNVKLWQGSWQACSSPSKRVMVQGSQHANGRELMCCRSSRWQQTSVPTRTPPMSQRDPKTEALPGSSTPTSGSPQGDAAASQPSNEHNQTQSARK